MKTLRVLQSSDAVLAVLVLALLAQMPHAQHVFFQFSKELGVPGWIQSWFAAIALEFAVLVFVVRSKTLQSWGFAAFSVAVNLVYYYDPQVAWYLPKATWLLSAGLPVAIALYSHEVANKHTEQADTVQPAAQVTRTHTKRNVQVDEQSEQYTVVSQKPIVQATVQPMLETVKQAVLDTVRLSSPTTVQPDFASMTSQEKKAYIAQLILAGTPINQSQTAVQLGVSRTTLSAWCKAVQG